MIKNNKLVYGFASIAATVLMALAPAAGVFAATSTAKPYSATPINSTAQIEVLEGGTPTNPNTGEPITDLPDLPDTNAKGEDLLQLVTVPDLNFGQVKAGDLITAQNDIKYVDTKVANGAHDNGNAHLTVSDYRGTGAGWTLKASLSKFTSDANSLTGSIDLKNTNVGIGDVGASDATFLGAGYKTLESGVNLPTDDTDQDLWVAPANQGAGMTIADLSASTLNLDANAAAKKGVYQATIKWTLSSTATPAAAGEGAATTDPTGTGN
ncbi:WxL domain-containing protein [Lacticaseibacillus sharpeae]|uniref:WxL domain-containing protein n=1 Tax=Lacticaseibacillus sharpeae JCM 1186 = DSM 20505 TaxID=1291052 RepID=A0A0R1ZME3_9LACO|nr:WxL domain-containing protein [Lacticaseibacillus sharpeae]KRM55626.1 hypothetical protein FC18_GL001131 [Lacticaseibacillus sharpeae JCM 1186 = DSM 20505]